MLPGNISLDSLQNQPYCVSSLVTYQNEIDSAKNTFLKFLDT